MYSLLFNNDWIAFLPELFLVTTINIIILYSVIFSTSPTLDFPLIINNATWLCLQIFLFVFFLINSNFFDSILLFNKSVIIDKIGTFVKIFVIFSSICVILISLSYIKVEFINSFEYPIFLLLNVLGIFLIISSCSLLSVYLAIELQTFSSYILSAFKRDSEFSTEAGLKYFILGSLSSGFLLFGLSLVYGFTGVVNYNDLHIILIDVNSDHQFYNEIFVGIIFILISFLFKFSASPFHIWTPDIYEGSPTIVTSFFAIVPKISLIIFFLRLFFGSFYSFFSSWQSLVLISSSFSMIVGCLGALWQIKFKRLLAFSTIGHVGYMLMGFCCGSIESLEFVIFYSIVYSILTICCFSLLLMIRKNNNRESVKYISSISSISKVNSFIGLAFAVTFYSIAGIPPFAGFYSKIFIFFNAIFYNLYFLVFLGVITSVISCFYYLFVLQTAYFEKVVFWISIEKINKEVAFVTSLTVFLPILFFFHHTLIIIFIENFVIDFFSFQN